MYESEQLDKGSQAVLMKNFKENDSFSIKKIVGSTLELSANFISHWTSTY